MTADAKVKETRRHTNVVVLARKTFRIFAFRKRRFAFISLKPNLVTTAKLAPLDSSTLLVYNNCKKWK